MNLGWNGYCDFHLFWNEYSSLTDVFFDPAVNEPDPFSDATESEEYIEVIFFKVWNHKASHINVLTYNRSFIFSWPQNLRLQRAE